MLESWWMLIGDMADSPERIIITGLGMPLYISYISQIVIWFLVPQCHNLTRVLLGLK